MRLRVEEISLGWVEVSDDFGDRIRLPRRWFAGGLEPGQTFEVGLEGEGGVHLRRLPSESLECSPPDG